MAFYVAAFTKTEYVGSLGSHLQQILEILQTASMRTLCEQNHSANYSRKTMMEVYTLDKIVSPYFPEEFDEYFELFYLNDPAFLEMQAVRSKVRFVGKVDAPP